MTDSMAQWLLSKQALLVAVTLFIVALANLIAAGGKVVTATLSLIDLLKTRSRRGVDVPHHARSAVVRGMLVVGISVSLGVIGIAILGGRRVAAANLPLNARLTTEAWDALNKQDWPTAIRKADECINQFRDMADDEQKQLESSNTNVPTGKVSKQEKDQILQRGPLNDVAASYFIKGKAEDALKRTADAKQAYEAASKYTNARCYDPSYDGFWSPADEANVRLKQLRATGIN